MSKDSGTRSGLLWQVERILLECKDTGIMPNILIMENVPEVKGSNNINDFTAWIRQLEKLGYSNYCKVLNAKNYGIPQNRNRCFMVSILGEYNYSFPKHIRLKYKLKDLLEKNVPEKFYLSKAMLDYCTGVNQKESKFPRGQRFQQSINKTNAGNRPVDNFVLENNNRENNGLKTKNKKVVETLEQNDLSQIEDVAYIDGFNRKIKNDGISATINTGVSFRNQDFIVVPNELIPFGSYYTWKDNQGNINTQCNRAVGENGVALTVACAETGKVLTNTLRIRKLTPKECWRLMGVLDSDSELVKQSDSSKYHLAGDSIVSTCLMGIFGSLLGIDYKAKIEELVENIRQK